MSVSYDCKPVSNRVIVSAAAGEHYQRLQVRTLAACQKYGEADVAFQTLRDVWHYGRKLDVISAAGHRFVMWMDCSFMPVASLEPLWKEIEERGWFVPGQGSSKLSTWASDEALIDYEITREQAAAIPMCLSGIVGLDTSDPVGHEIFRRWKLLRRTFNGAHYNRPGEPQKVMGDKLTGHVSWDASVEGHRHDEAALSFVLWKLGLEPIRSRYLEVDQPEGFIIGRNFVNIDGTYADF
jgi:hypothetical protein